jgi:membrane protease YdiL (CAAX protease family)
MQDLRAGTILLPADAQAPVRTARGWVIVAAPPLTFLLLLLLVIGATVVGMLVVRPMPSEAVVQAYAARFSTDPVWVQLLTILQDLLFIFVVWLLLPKRGPAALAGYFPRVSLATVVVALASGVVLSLAVAYGTAILQLRHVVTFHETVAEHALVPHSTMDVAPGFAAVALAAPLAEELYFRGVLLRWLQTKLHVFWAALLSASLFALVHFRIVDHPGLEGWVLTGGIAALGFVNALWAAGTRSLWPAIAVHSAYNGTIVVFSVLAPYLPSP